MASLVSIGDMVINLDAVLVVDRDPDTDAVRLYFAGPDSSGQWPKPLVLSNAEADHFWAYVTKASASVDGPSLAPPRPDR